MRTEKIKIYSNGLFLSGVITLPDNYNNGRQWPAVLILHGWGSSKDRKRPTLTAEKLAERGIVSLRFDFRGHGESKGSIIKTELKGMVSDVEACWHDLIKDWNANPERMGIIGASVGGSATILAMSKIKFRAGMLLCPRSDYHTGIEKGTYTIERNGKKLVNLVMMKSGRRINFYHTSRNISCPVLIIHGTDDTMVPPTQSRLLARQSRKFLLELIDDGDHTLQAYSPQLAERAADFFSKHLL